MIETKEDRVDEPLRKPYEPPVLLTLGSVQELTQVCDKRLGGSDGWTFMGQDIVCSSR